MNETFDGNHHLGHVLAYMQSDEGIKRVTALRDACRKRDSAYHLAYANSRRVRDADWKRLQNFRACVNSAIFKKWVPATGFRRDTDTIERYCGCSWQELRAHFEGMFREGMTWENHGRTGWHVDHIKPLCEFDISKEEELYKAWFYTNLRPLWHWENRAKGLVESRIAREKKRKTLHRKSARQEMLDAGIPAEELDKFPDFAE